MAHKQAEDALNVKLLIGTFGGFLEYSLKH